MFRGGVVIVHGDCLAVMAEMDAESVDSIVCDPPYGISFMGKEWDHGVPTTEIWVEALRVLKPGGHLLAFGGTRLFHRLTVNIEDAGFEIRDCLMWLYGSGFPKSHNVALSIDKASGHPNRGRAIPTASTFQASDKNRTNKLISNPVDSYTAKSEESERWNGWGTALKPAWEPIIMARKPIVGTVAANVLQHGTGALNIDASRIGTDQIQTNRYTPGSDMTSFHGSQSGNEYVSSSHEGRWPANLILSHTPECVEVGTANEVVGGGAKMSQTGKAAVKFGGGYEGGDGFVGTEVVTTVWDCHPDCPVKLLDEQSGTSKSAGGRNKNITPSVVYGGGKGLGATGAKTETADGVRGDPGFGDVGGASRFFYCAKTSKVERNLGLDNLEPREIGKKGNGLGRTCDTCGASVIGGCSCPNRTFSNPQQLNPHPTVKPQALMRYLTKMVTPPDGLVLDPFCGSGSTGVAAITEGFRFIGIDLDGDIIPVAEARVAHAKIFDPQATFDFGES